MKKAVAYFRVSTQRQGASGLGLDAQQHAVAEFAAANGYAVDREFCEVESGKRNDRPVLREAIACAKQTRSTLLIAKLDRLARNVAFIANLMDSDVDFRAVDLPEANRLLLHIMSAVAEAEGRAISDRTVAALQAAKARGTALGALNPASRNLTREAALNGARRGAASTAQQAREYYASVEPMIQQLRNDGASLKAIAAALNANGARLRSGKPWSAVQVGRVLRRT